MVNRARCLACDAMGRFRCGQRVDVSRVRPAPERIGNSPDSSNRVSGVAEEQLLVREKVTGDIDLVRVWSNGARVAKGLAQREICLVPPRQAVEHAGEPTVKVPKK